MMRRRTISTSLALTLLLGTVLPLRGDDAPPAEDTVLKYREIYVPEDAMNELVRGLLPIKRDKFLQMIRSLDASSETSTPAAQITSGRYRATLDGQSLNGTGILNVTSHSDNAVRLPLEPCGIAIDRPMWSEGEDLGAVIASDSDGKHVLVVDRSGELDFPWSLRGSRSVAGVVKFDVALPRSAMNELTVRLPKGMTPRIEDALVKRLDEDAGAPEWRIELGGKSRFQLRIEPDDLEDDLDRAPLLRSTLEYDLSAAAVTVSAELRLDLLHEPLRELSLRLDAPLNLLSASVGDQELASRQFEPERGTRRVVLIFPEPLAGVGRVVRLFAKCPLPRDQLWRLPTISVDRVHWQEGSIALAVRDPLSVESLTTRQCKQSKLRTLTAPRSGQIIQIQCFRHDAEVQLRLGQRAARVQHAAGTSISIDGTELVANVTADLSAESGEQFSLEADFPQEWIVDSVQAHLLSPDSEPSDVLDFWEVTVRNPRNRKLGIRLSRPVQAGRTIRVKVRGHRWLPTAEESLGIMDFRFLSFRNSRETRHLISVGNSPSRQFKFDNDLAANWLTRADLSTYDLELIDEGDDAVVLLSDKRVASLTGTLRAGVPRYSCKIKTEATVSADTLEEVYRIRCEPHTSQLRRVIVLLSHPRKGLVQWQLQGDEEHAVAARRLTSNEQSELGFRESGFEAWEVALRRPRIAPFTLVGRRRSPLNKPSEVCVASLPDASSQTGTLLVLSDGGTSIAVSGRGAEAVPAASVAPDEYSAVRAVFEYDPGKRPGISVSPVPEPDQTPAAIAWACRIETRLANGRPTHIVTYFIENWGKPQISIKLPANVSLRSLAVDGNERLSRRDYSREEIVVSLPMHVRFPTLRLVYAERKSSPLIVGEVSAPKAEIDIPVLHQQWTLWLPPGLEPAGDASSAEEDYALGPRLFGGFHRGSQRNFETGGTWQTLVEPFQSGKAGTREAEAALESLEKTLAEVTSQADGQAPRWGDLLALWESEAGDPDSKQSRTVLVDVLALPQLGIHPETRLPPNAEDVPSLLAQSNLVLVLQGDRCFVTARIVAAMNVDRVAATSERSILIAPADGLDSHSPFDSPSGRFLPAAVWNAGLALPQLPWQVSAPVDYVGVPGPGWTAYRVDSLDGADLTVRVQRTDVIRAFGWGAFLLSAALGWWIACGRPRRLILLIGLTGCGALAAPEFYAAVATKLFLGSLFASLLIIVLKPRATRPVAPTAEAASRLAKATAVVLFCLLGGWIAFAMADDAPADKTPATTVYRVVVPLDQDQQPTEEVYVPRDFYKALHKLSEPGSERTWFVESAKYDCRLEWAAVGKRLEITELSTTYELEVLNATQIVLPISSQELHLLPDRATLDDQPVAADWTQDGNGLVVQVPRRGKQNLHLAFRPTLERAYQMTGFEAAILPNARSQLSLSLPEGSPAVEVPTALGSWRRDDTGQLQYDLGSTNRLAVRWPTAPDDGAEAGLAVEELQWLRIDPGSTAIDTRFRFVVPSGQVLREVELAIDPRLEIQIRDNQPVRVKQLAEQKTDGLRRVQLELKEPARDALVFSATFSLAGAAASGPSGVGALRLPDIRAIADQRLRRWLAVSINPAFEFEYDESALEEIPDADFIGRWGDAPAAPQLVLRLGEASGWDVQARPRRAEIIAKQRLDMSIGRKDAEVTFTSDMTISGGSLFQLQMRAPRNLHVDEISISEDGIERVASWSRAEKQVLHVFLNAPITGRQELRLRGEIPIRANRPLTLPRIATDQANVERQQFLIYRRSDVLLEVQSIAGVLSVADKALGNYAEHFGRLWAVFETHQADAERPKEQPAITLSLKPNRPFEAEADGPQPRCTIVTTLRRDDNVWTADVECELHNIQGVADAVRLEIPASLRDVINLATNEPLESNQTSGHNRQTVLVRSPKSIEGDSRFHIRGTLASQPTVAPDVFPTDFPYEAVDRYVTLPTHADSRQIEWDINGLREAALPRDYGEPYPTPGDYLTYLVTSPDGRATVRNVRAALGEPQIHLADIRSIRVGPERALTMAMFDLEPTDLTACVLALPEGASPIQTFVGGLPATLVRMPNNRWMLRLGPSHVPQRIEMIYRAVPYFDSVSPVVLTPNEVVIPALNKLWTVHDVSKFPGRDGNGRLSQDLELRRLTALAAMFTQATDSIHEQPQEHVDNWYTRWAGRVAASSANLELLSRFEHRRDEFPQDDVEAVETRHAEIAVELDAARIRTDALNSVHNSAQRQALWNLLMPTQGTTYYAVDQQENIDKSLSMESQTSLFGGWLARAGAGIAFLSLMVALYFLLEHWLGEWLAQFSHAAGVLLGLAWSLWLTPSFVGWIIVAVSVLLATRLHGARVRAAQ